MYKKIGLPVVTALLLSVLCIAQAQDFLSDYSSSITKREVSNPFYYEVPKYLSDLSTENYYKYCKAIEDQMKTQFQKKVYNKDDDIEREIRITTSIKECFSSPSDLILIYNCGCQFNIKLDPEHLQIVYTEHRTSSGITTRRREKVRNQKRELLKYYQEKDNYIYAGVYREYNFLNISLRYTLQFLQFVDTE